MAEQRPGRQTLTVALFGMAVMLGIAFVVWLTPDTVDPEPTVTATESSLPGLPSRTPRPTDTPAPTPTVEASPSPVPTPLPPKVGIVAGHWQSDSGAICDDGLQEVSINLDIASRVVARLQSRGYSAELLPEYSDRLPGYVADALVSIHADACNVPEATGFKVARVAASAIPEVEDRLVACLVDKYGAATGLPFHANSITFDMTLYHAFNEIDPHTPGAIIELGFMGADRELLTGQAHIVAEGVVQGIVCFLEGE